MNKKQKEEQRRLEDQALNRGLIWVGAAVLLELALLFVKRYYLEYEVAEVELAVALSNGLRFLRIAGVVLAVAFVVWAVLRLKKDGKAALPIILALAMGALTICSHVSVVFKDNGVRMLFLLVPAWAGLALVYYLYQRDFFLAASASGLAVLGLWFVRYSGGAVRMETIAVLAAIVLILAAVVWLKGKNGQVNAGGNSLQVLPKGTSYTVALASCLVSLAAVVLALALGGAVAYYLIFLMIAWLFALLVYYTVKMM